MLIDHEDRATFGSNVVAVAGKASEALVRAAVTWDGTTLIGIDTDLDAYTIEQATDLVAALLEVITDVNRSTE